VRYKRINVQIDHVCKTDICPCLTKNNQNVDHSYVILRTMYMYNTIKMYPHTSVNIDNCKTCTSREM